MENDFTLSELNLFPQTIDFLWISSPCYYEGWENYGIHVNHMLPKCPFLYP